MAICAPCPNCKKEFVFDHALGGKVAKCPECRGPVPVPLVKATAVRIDEEPEPFAPATAKQLAFLRTLGVKPEQGLSLEAATHQIRAALAAEKAAEEAAAKEASQPPSAPRARARERITYPLPQADRRERRRIC